MKKLQQIYSGKAKTLYETEDPDSVIVQFRDDTSAFDGLKIKQFERKGMVNNYFNAYIMNYLEEHQGEGEIVTGLLYLDHAGADMHELNQSSPVAMRDLPFEVLCPGEAALQKLQDEYR